MGEVRRLRVGVLDDRFVTADHEGDDWDSAYVGMPPAVATRQITLRLDPDTIEYFREQGLGYQARINQVLPSYVDHQRRKAS